MTKISVTLFGFIISAVICLINAQRQIPSNQFFPLQRPNLQLIQLHAQQQLRPSFSPINQRRIFRTQQQQQQQQQITRRPIPRISLRRRSLSSERILRAGISRNKPARIILDPNLSNEKITKTSDNRFFPQLRTQGNADFSRATTVAPQRFAPPRQSPQQRPPSPIEVTPSRSPAIRPPVLRRPSPPLSSTQSQTLQQRPPQSPQRQQQRPPPQQQQQQMPSRPPMQQPQPRSPPPQQPQRQTSSRTSIPQQQQQQLPQRASTQQQSFLRPPPPSLVSPRMPQPPPSPQMSQISQNRSPVSPTMQRPPMPRPQPRPALTPPSTQQQIFNNQPRPAPTMPSPQPPPPPPPQQQQQMRPRITPEQRFTRPDQARIFAPPPSASAPIGPPRPSPPLTTNNIDDPSPLLSRARPSSSPSAHMPGFLPPSNSVVDELNNSKNFLEVARRLRLRRVIRGSAH